MVLIHAEIPAALVILTVMGDIFVDFSYWLDLYLRFRVSFIDSGIIISGKKEVAKNYIKNGYFVMDLLASITIFYPPLYLVIPQLSDSIVMLVESCDQFTFGVLGTIVSNPLSLYAFLRSNHILKAVNFTSYFKMWESFAKRPVVVRLSKLVLLILIMLHYLTCVYILLCDLEGFGSTEFVLEKKWQNVYAWEQYNIAFFLTTSYVTGLGEAAKQPVTSLEVFFCLLMIVIGIMVLAAVVANVGALITSLNQSEEDFRSKMDVINSFMQTRNLPVIMQDRIRKYYGQLWSRQKGVDDYTILKELPAHMATDVSLFLNREIVEKVPLFRNCQVGFIEHLVRKLQPMIYVPGDDIVKVGTLGQEMYFISRGKCEVLSENGLRVATIHEGGFFGEIALLFDSKRTATVRAITYCDTFVLAKGDLDTLLESFPEQKLVMQAEASSRLAANSLSVMIPTVPLFEHCGKNFTRAIVSKLVPLDFQAGDTIVTSGQWTATMYFVSSGEVAFYSDQGELMDIVVPGNFFHEYSMVRQFISGERVVASVPTRVFALEKSKLEDLLDQFPSQKYFVNRKKKILLMQFGAVPKRKDLSQQEQKDREKAALEDFLRGLEARAPSKLSGDDLIRFVSAMHNVLQRVVQDSYTKMSEMNSQRFFGLPSESQTQAGGIRSEDGSIRARRKRSLSLNMMPVPSSPNSAAASPGAAPSSWVTEASQNRDSVEDSEQDDFEQPLDDVPYMFSVRSMSMSRNKIGGIDPSTSHSSLHNRRMVALTASTAGMSRISSGMIHAANAPNRFADKEDHSMRSPSSASILEVESLPGYPDLSASQSDFN